MGRPNVLTLFTENENLHDENNSGRSANFYCAWHGARKKRLHSQLLEFLNTNNILWDQWVGSGPPHPAQVLRLQTGSDCAASQHARPRASLGDTVGLGGGARPGCGQVQYGARASLPAGGAREAHFGVARRSAHLQCRAGKHAGRWAVPCAELPRLSWPCAPQRLPKTDFPERPLEILASL